MGQTPNRQLLSTRFTGVRVAHGGGRRPVLWLVVLVGTEPVSERRQRPPSLDSANTDQSS